MRAGAATPHRVDHAELHGIAVLAGDRYVLTYEIQAHHSGRTMIVFNDSPDLRSARLPVSAHADDIDGADQQGTAHLDRLECAARRSETRHTPIPNAPHAHPECATRRSETRHTAIRKRRRGGSLRPGGPGISGKRPALATIS
jgi:hypothetical protein